MSRTLSSHITASAPSRIAARSPRRSATSPSTSSSASQAASTVSSAGNRRPFTTLSRSLIVLSAPLSREPSSLICWPFMSSGTFRPSQSRIVGGRSIPATMPSSLVDADVMFAGPPRPRIPIGSSCGASACGGVCMTISSSFGVRVLISSSTAASPGSFVGSPATTKLRCVSRRWARLAMSSALPIETSGMRPASLAAGIDSSCSRPVTPAYAAPPGIVCASSPGTMSAGADSARARTSSQPWNSAVSSCWK
jgi:hypothetical protein